MQTITKKIRKEQFKYDIIGKDSQRGVTLSYAWLANQLGHFTLGMLTTILLYFILYFCNLEKLALIIPPIMTVGLWTGFEIFNVTKSMHKKSLTNPFTPDWKNIKFDTFCDLVFFSLGAFGGMLVFTQTNNIIFITITVIIFISTRFIYLNWYPIKIVTQFAYFPFQYRISQWNKKISDFNKNLIQSYISNKEKKHIVIFGGENTGKTSLAVSIATEFTIQKIPCFYTTGIKFIQLLNLSDEDFKNNYSLPWSWREIEYLVIDDINAGDNIEEFFKPTFFQKVIDNSQYSDLNKKTISSIPIIWVLGKKETKQDWINFLKGYSIEDKNIVTIEL